MEGGEVLVDAQVGEDLTPFGHERDAGAGDAVRRPARDLATGEGDAAGARRQQSHHRANERRLAHAVATEHADDLAWRDREIDAEQHLRPAVAGVDRAHLEQRRRHHALSSPR